MIYQLLYYIGVLVGTLLALIALLPIPKLLYYKIKYGNKVDIFYFPFIGLLGQVIYDGMRRADVFYSQKRYLTNNPNLKMHISSDLKGGVHYSLLDPTLKRIFYNEQDAFKKMEGMPFSDMFMDQGLLFQTGDKWSKARKLLTQHFTYESLKRIVGTLKEQCQLLQPKNGTIDIMEFAKQLTSDVITKAFFGIESTSNVGKDVNDNMNQMMKLFMNPLVLLRCFALKLNKETTPKLLLSGREIVFSGRVREQKRQITAEIDKRIQQLKDNNTVEDNILTTMSKAIIDEQITKEEAIHQYFTLLIAGIDSTSHFLKNCCYALATNMDVQIKLRQEIQAIVPQFNDLDSSNLSKIKYLSNFIDEVFRHYTPSPSLFNRVAVRDIQLGEFLIRKGQSLDINYIMSNFDPSVFKDPLKFDVERWSTPLSDTFAFTPFSAGTRNCIGQHLSLMELKTILIYLVLKYELTLAVEKVTLGLSMMYGPVQPNFLALRELNS